MDIFHLQIDSYLASTIHFYNKIVGLNVLFFYKLPLLWNWRFDSKFIKMNADEDNHC